MGFFEAAPGGCGGPKTPLPPSLPYICHTYPTMMKFGTIITYLKKIKKIYMNHVTHLLSSADISIFSSEITIFCYIKKYRHRFHFHTSFLILLTCIVSLKIFLINLVTILMMSEKIATPLKIKVFLNVVYDVIIYVHYVTSKILSRDSNYIVDMVM